ncbi:carboxypeptidase-like regulatory domain-containing protein [Haloferula sp. BvORR071]|uniref:carboxypeptidase-like regulatory domain-containing protein n=1 Tax=Haloferula sp. BvORR071 TaxID=1396141 RepID=UPI0005598C71|nr:carboxypeptidase-like regulatory domain-containing protein [Haloferula sp. BvORR071]
MSSERKRKQRKKEWIVGLTMGFLTLAAFFAPVWCPSLFSIRGSVVDQNGRPLAGAKIIGYRGYAPAWEPRPATGDTNAKGEFKIPCLRMFVSGVTAEVPGHIPDPLAHTMPTHLWNRDEQRPGFWRVVMLDVADDSVPLVRKPYRREALKPDNKPWRVALDDKGGHVLEFKLERGPSAPQPLTGTWPAPFRWTLRLDAWDGQVSDREVPRDVAPQFFQDAHVRVWESVRPVSEGWRSESGKRQAYVKFDDGTYAWIEFQVFADSDGQCLGIQSRYNPRPGSRWVGPEH